MDLKPQLCQPLWITEDLCIRTLKNSIWTLFLWFPTSTTVDTSDTSCLQWLAGVNLAALQTSEQSGRWTQASDEKFKFYEKRDDFAASNQTPVTSPTPPNLALWMGWAGACHPSDSSAGATGKVILSLHQLTGTTKAPPSPRAAINFTRSPLLIKDRGQWY